MDFGGWRREKSCLWFKVVTSGQQEDCVVPSQYWEARRRVKSESKRMILISTCWVWEAVGTLKMRWLEIVTAPLERDLGSSPLFTEGSWVGLTWSWRSRLRMLSWHHFLLFTLPPAIPGSHWAHSSIRAPCLLFLALGLLSSRMDASH